MDDERGSEEGTDEESDEERMEDDNQKWDPEVRRRQRRSIRRIIHDVQEHRDNMVMPEDLVQNVKRMDRVFREVGCPREAAIDAEGFKLLSTIGKEQAESSAGELVFDPMIFVEKLVTFMGGRRGDRGELDWAKLGDKAASCFKTVPNLSFLHGALDPEPIKRRQQQRSKGDRREEEEVKVTKPMELTEFGGEEETTTKDIAHLFAHLKRVCGEGDRVHYYSFVVDPKSFSRTVENMFHFSFLVKDGRAGIHIDEDENQPYIHLPVGGKSKKTTKNQAVISINMAQWRRAVEKFDIKSAMIPLREDP